MIEIRPERKQSVLERLYRSAKIPMNERSMAAVAFDGDEVIGNCLFDMDDDSLTVRSINPSDDVMFADGLLRSALHIGTENGIMTAYYSDESPIDLLNKLNFIKNETKKELDVEKLFKSCKNC